jgi:hypothetical protein
MPDSSECTAFQPTALPSHKEDRVQPAIQITIYSNGLKSASRSLATIAAALVLGGSFCLAVYDPSCRSAFFSMAGGICGRLIQVVSDSNEKK